VLRQVVGAVVLSVAGLAGACGPGASAGPERGAESARRAEARAEIEAPEAVAREVDELLRTSWKAGGITPAPRVDDAGFLRRAWLDLAGVVPPPDVVTRFLADEDLDKRARAVAQLTRGPRWGERWAQRYDELLLGHGTKEKLVDRDGFHAWVRDAFTRNVAYDRFVTDLVTATGRNRADDERTRVNGAVNWLVRFKDAPEELAGTASRAFLGVQIQCAQCHDHKTEKWKQEDFRRFTACFLRMKAEPPQGDATRGELELFDVDKPAFLRTGKKKLMSTPYYGSKPAALDGTDLSKAESPRRALASWITNGKNPWFAKAFVNRVWSMMLGRGFVNPVDDLRPSNAPLAPEAFERLARDFKASRYDVRRLVTVVASTEAYQLASSPTAAGEGRMWSRFPDKPLDADQLLDAIVAATGIAPVLATVSNGDEEGLRADLRKQMSFVFDVDESGGEARYDGTIAQALSLLNGKLVNTGASAIAGGALDAILRDDISDAEVVRRIYVRVLGRLPDADEVAHWLEFVGERRTVARDDGPADKPAKGPKRRRAAASAGDRKLAKADRLLPRRPSADEQAFEDVMFALLDSSEFTFNH
jgi:hypothetical protein